MIYDHTPDSYWAKKLGECEADTAILKLRIKKLEAALERIANYPDPDFPLESEAAEARRAWEIMKNVASSELGKMNRVKVMMSEDQEFFCKTCGVLTYTDSANTNLFYCLDCANDRIAELEALLRECREMSFCTNPDEHIPRLVDATLEQSDG